ncbi:MAG: response regulator [Kofleriaceae bacterium]
MSDAETSRAPPVIGDLRGTETILLVEDEVSVRSVAADILRRFGYTVLTSSNVEHAELIARSHPGQIDLLLTDVVMPGLGGPALAAKISVLRPQIAVLFMSGYTDDSIVRHGVIDAQLAFLQKPFTPETLGHTVRSTLDTRP